MKSQTTIKIGLFGVGTFGTILLEMLQQKKQVEVIGYYDTDEKPSLKIKRFDTIESLIDMCDVVTIASNTASHYNILNQALKTAKPILIARPMVNNIHQSKEINAIAQEAKTNCHIIYLDKMHPCFHFVKKNIATPKFVHSNKQIHYANTQNQHLIYEGMADQIDIIRHLITSPIKSIKARGFSIKENRIPDIVNAHIDFFNGEFANIMISRLSHIEQHTLDLYDAKKNVCVDLVQHSCQMTSFETKKAHKTTVSYETVLNDNPHYCLTQFLDIYIEHYQSDTLYSTTADHILSNEYDALKSLEVADIVANQVEKYMNYIN